MRSTSYPHTPPQPKHHQIGIAIQHIILSMDIDLTVPRGPRYGMLLKIAATPLAIQGRVFMLPKPLPIKEFNEQWNKLADFLKLQAWRQAQDKATTILSKQKLKTGTAILGKPIPELNDNLLYQGNLKKQNIKVGEDLAFKALSIEKLVLAIAEIPSALHYQYTGRSQYHRIKIKSLTKANSDSIIEQYIKLSTPPLP